MPPLRTALFVLALASGVSSLPTSVCAQPSEAALTSARERHQRGVALMQETPPNYSAAVTEFAEAHRLLEGHPRRYIELRNIAECYQNLGQYDRALEFFQRYLTDGGPGAEDRARYEAAIAALESMLGTVDVRVNLPSAEVWVDDRRVGSAPGPVRVPGGRHTVELRAPGHSPARQELEIASRQTVSRSFTLEALGRGLSPVLFWTGLGATVVAGAVGAVFGLRAMSARSDVDQRLASTSEATRFSVTAADRDDIASMALTADVLYATAGALGVGTVVVLFLTDFHRGRSEDRPVTVGPALSAHTTGLSLTGSF